MERSELTASENQRSRRLPAEEPPRRPQSTLRAEISKVVAQAQERLMSERNVEGYWKYQACLGTHFVSQFYLLSRWMELPFEKFKESEFKAIVLESQRPDGSWQQWPDKNIRGGDLDATIIHYWALKVMGEDIHTQSLTRAREFILKNGGIKKSTLFIQVIMAMFGNWSWKNIPYIPYLIFLEHMPCNYKSFSHWSKPHVMAFSYMRHLKIQKDLGPIFRLDELTGGSRDQGVEPRAHPTSLIDGAVVQKILDQQLKYGSWNGYTTSTLFSLVVLTDYESFHPKKDPKIRSGIAKGFKFLEDLAIDKSASPYLGVSCDGRNWDTVLVLDALLESGKTPAELKRSLEYTREVQSPDGGLGYGIDFEGGPDTDDTSELVKLWTKANMFLGDRDRAVRWLVAHQNTSGGWGAFDKDNESSLLMKFVTKGFENSDSLFDFPSADCTGHALEAIGVSGLAGQNSKAVSQGIEFLKARQNRRTGSWEARWAVNHLFGTTVAVAGLLRVGEDPTSTYLQRALKWLSSCQNPDGGFGESTQSYIDSSWIGRGVSTPSQSAWGLLGLMEFGSSQKKDVERAARFLVEQHDSTKGWIDPCAIGTGHPGSVYMQYNSYAKAFPLLALSKFLKRI